MSFASISKRFATKGLAARETKTVVRGASPKDAYDTAIKAQIEAFEAKKPENRGSWIKKAAEGADHKYTVHFGSTPVPFVIDGQTYKYLKADSLEEAIAVLKEGKELTKEPTFVAALEKIVADRKATRAANAANPTKPKSSKAK